MEKDGAGPSYKRKRATVPGTAALGGCCYFNPRPRRARPEELVRTRYYNFIRGFTAGISTCFISGSTFPVFLPFTGFAFFAITLPLSWNTGSQWICLFSTRAATVVPAAPLDVRDAILRPRRLYRRAPDDDTYLPGSSRLSGLVASSFFAFFKVFLAILFSL